MSLFTSLSTRTPPSKRRLALLSVNFLLAMNAYKTWRPYCKMPTADFPSRIRSSRHNCKLSRRDWIRHAVSLLVKHRMCLVEFNKTFNTAQKAAGSSPLNFGRIAKPLRGGGGASAATADGPIPISGGGAANPLTRIQNEEGG